MVEITRAHLAGLELALKWLEFGAYRTGLGCKGQIHDLIAQAKAAPEAEAMAVPAGWAVERVGCEDGYGFIVRSPRIDGRSSGTAVWSDAENPAERLLAILLAEAEIKKLRGGSVEPIGYTTPGMLEIAVSVGMTGRLGVRRERTSRFCVPLYTHPAPEAGAPAERVVVPEGYALVPIEPTRAMLHRAYDNNLMPWISRQSTGHDRAAEVWESMLAAAPAAEPLAGHVSVPVELLGRAAAAIEKFTYYPFGEPQTPRDADFRAISNDLRTLFSSHEQKSKEQGQ